MASPEHTPDIDITKYRQYLSTQRRVSEWVNKTRPQAALTTKPKKSSSTDGRQSRRRSDKASRQLKDQHHTLHTMTGVEMTTVPPVVALVSSSLMVWSLDLLPLILALCAFAWLLTLATKTINQRQLEEKSSSV